MIRKLLLMALCVPFMAGGTCSITIGPGDGDDGDGIDGPTVTTRLDRATLTLRIVESAATGMSTASADITYLGRSVELQAGQSVQLNGVALTGPSTSGRYAASVPIAETYVVRISDPALGDSDTNVAAVGGFEITAPVSDAAVSLANGFDLAWTNADANLTYEVVLRQPEVGASVRLGPFADNAGSLTIAPENLTDFRHGVDAQQQPLELAVELTRTREVSEIIGVAADSSVAIERTATVSVIPGP